MFLEKLLNEEDDSLPPLNDAHFKDEEQRVYRDFLSVIKEQGITMPLIYNEQFKMLKKLKENPKIIENFKKGLETYIKSQKNMSSKNQKMFENVKIAGEDYIDNIPVQFFFPRSSLMNVITKEAQQAYSLRELMYDLLPLYNDDKIININENLNNPSRSSLINDD